MIVRINQIDPAQAEALAGWPERPLAGSVECTWPQGTRAFEIVVLDRDEKERPLSDEFRREQIRKLIPTVLAALGDDEPTVLRLDGPFAEGELLAAYRHLATNAARFSTSPLEQLEPGNPAVIGSVRFQPAPDVLAAICQDVHLGLHRDVRLRAYRITDELVSPLIDTAQLDDERWPELLNAASVVLHTALGLKSLQAFTRKLTVAEARERLTKRLSQAVGK